LVIKNAFRFGAVHTVGAIFMFIGKIFITLATAISCYAMLTYWE
jgi:hypothetical protein